MKIIRPEGYNSWGQLIEGDPNNPANYQPTPDQNLIQAAIDEAPWSGIRVDAAGNLYREKAYTYANPTAWTTSESGSPVEIGGLGYPSSPEGTSTRKVYEFFDAQGNKIDKGPFGVPAGFAAPSQGGLIDFVQENGWVVPLALATAGAGLQLSAGAAAGTGAAQTSGAAGLTGGGAFVPAAGSGASFALPGAVAAGSAAAPLTTSQILGSTGFTPAAGSGASFGIAPGAAYTTGSGLLSGTTGTNTGTAAMEELFGPTYQELGITGLEAGQMGPTYAELGLTGLNTEAAISAADIAAAASQGINASTLTSLAKQYGVPALKALLGGKTGTGTAATSDLGSILGGLLGGATNIALTDQQRQAIQNAYNTQSQAVGAAGQQAQNLASFTPIGTTNFFGSSQFTRDPVTGQLTSAGFTPTAQVQGQLQNLFGLGAQALPTTADTQAIQQQYIAQQQGLLAPGREQQLAQLQNTQYQRGTTGLATGGTRAGYAPNAQGLMATNPAMQAYYNAQAQQDAALAARAPTYAQDLLNAQINTGTGLFGAANTLQGYAQQPLSLSTDLAKAQAAAGASAGQLGLTGATRAAELGAQGSLLSNAAMQGTYNQLGQTASGLGQTIGNFLNTNPTIQEWLK